MRPLSAACLLLTLSSLSSALAPPPPPAHWAFRAPRRPVLPRIKAIDSPRTPIDAFVIARLEAAALMIAPEADRALLLRRLTFDLIGLPPTPAEVHAFVTDRRPDAFERVVERLLTDPRYGERWAQHWLDVVRYAETNGYEADGERPQSWRYRDWVVQALNSDLSYDRFLTEQLAGDLLARGRAEADDSIIAAGFNRCGPIHQVSGNVDPLETRHELLNEMTSGLGAAFLGLTLSCARCHDHKFDPISQKDYYRFEAFFSAARVREVDLAPVAERARHTRDLALIQARLLPLRNQIASIEAPYRARLHKAKLARLEPAYREALAVDVSKRTPAQQKLVQETGPLLNIAWDEVVAALSETDRVKRSGLRKQMHDLEASKPAPPARAWSLNEGTEPLAAHVLRRGDIHRHGLRVVPGVPTLLGGLAGAEPANRIGLARWLTRADHPLTARVIVNRLWQHHFGRGLVATPNDFGLRGDLPTHPELLDWLAVELVESGWSLKHIHRLIVQSAVYRQGGKKPGMRGALVDAGNRLLWHMPRRRLEAEALRDSVLAVSGQLTPRLGGPMVRVPLEPEVYDLIFTEGEPDGLWPVTRDPREHTRRSLYLFNKRTVRLPMLESFDQPDTLTSCSVRPVSTFAPQALILLNSPFMQQQAGAFAVRLWQSAGEDARAQVELAYRLALGRSAKKVEVDLGVGFLDQQTDLLRDRLCVRKTVALPAALPEAADPARIAALADFCLALLNRNAFVHVE